MRPNSGFFWLDALFIFVLAALQFSVIPGLFGPYVYVDLLTGWLVVIMIQQRPFPALVLGIIAACIIESHLTTPIGLYLSSYALLLCIIINLKDPLSWTHQTPWNAVVVGACIWVALFELIVLSMVQDRLFMDWRMAIAVMVRMLLSVIFGLWICNFQIRTNLRETAA